MAKRPRSQRPGRPAAGASRREEGEFRSTTEIRTALIEGQTFRARPVQYTVVDGLAIVEGDIVLGTEEEVAQKTDELRRELAGEIARGVLITGAQFRWPNCVVPYTIDAGLPNQNRVTDAIAHWQQHTRFRFVQRTSEADYVTFRPSSGCSSSVGRRGGQQFVNLGSGCTTGNCIHEIGHVVGLWHEQSRQDRDAFVTVHWDKIQAGMEHNFNQHITDGDDVGAYDYGSIMHYPRNAFSVDGSDTLTPIAPGASIGQRTALSGGDIAAANSMCPKATKEIVKDTVKDVVLDTRKELTKDVRLDTRKEIVLDTRKEVIKDNIKEVAFDPGTTLAENVINPGQPVVNPVGPIVGPVVTGGIGGVRGAQPFAVATPHQAAAAREPGAGAAPSQVPELDAQLAAIAERLLQVDADRALLQAQYDETAALLQQAIRAEEEKGSA